MNIIKKDIDMKKIILLASLIMVIATSCDRDFDQPNPNSLSGKVNQTL
jgi:hypothetical protein